MTDDNASAQWRAVPPALWVGLGASLAYALVLGMASYGSDVLARWALADQGVTAMTSVLCAYGARDLARRLTGRAALGAQIAMFGWIASLVSLFFWRWLWMSGVITSSFETWGRANAYSWVIIGMFPAIGLAIAAWSRRRVLATTGLALAITAHLPFDLWGLVQRGIGESFVKIFLVAINVLDSVSLIVLVVAASSGRDNPEPARAAAGLRRAAGALRMRVVAALVVAGLTMIVMLGNTVESSLSVLKLAMISGLVINTAAFAWFGLGALAAARATVADLPRYPLTIASAMSLWCGAAMLAQLPYVYRMLYGSGERDDLAVYVQALSLALPLVALLGVVLVSVAIGSLARRRGLEALSAQTSAKTVGFVVLMIVSVAIQTWMVPTATSRGSAAFLMLAAAGCGLAAMVMMGQLCDQAAVAVEAEPGLPVAKLVNDP